MAISSYFLLLHIFMKLFKNCFSESENLFSSSKNFLQDSKIVISNIVI